MNKIISVDELKEWIIAWLRMNKYYHSYSKNKDIPIDELYSILDRIPESKNDNKN